MEACPSCGVVNPTFYRIKKRPCFSCADCRHQIYPMVGTIFQASQTPLTSWFYVIYLFATSKNGVSGKEIQRQIGVTYKCAWRMGHCVRILMDEGEYDLKGIVEADEALYGGRAKGGKRGWGAGKKVCMFGMIERKGKVKIKVVTGRAKEIILPIIGATVLAGATIYSDEYKAYRNLDMMGFKHESVIHSRYQWAKGECNTNSIEGFWSNLKKCLFGTHTHVSAKYLQNYLNEFGFRHNHRKDEVMFDVMLENV